MTEGLRYTKRCAEPSASGCMFQRRLGMQGEGYEVLVPVAGPEQTFTHCPA